MLLPKEVVQVWSASYTPHPIALRWTYDKLCTSKIDYCLSPFDCVGLGMLLLKAGGGVRVPCLH